MFVSVCGGGEAKGSTWYCLALKILVECLRVLAVGRAMVMADGSGRWRADTCHLFDKNYTGMELQCCVGCG